MKKSILVLMFLVFSVAVYADFAFGNAPFVNTWKILGPISERVGYNYDMIGEATIEPKLGETTKNLTWEYLDDRLFSRNYDDYVDVYSYYKVKKNINPDGVVVYLHDYVYSPKEQQVQFRVSGDRYFKVFLNGNTVGGSRAGSPGLREKFDNVLGGGEPSQWFMLQDNASKDFFIYDVVLKEGWNSVLIKLGNERESVLGLYFRVSDKDGNAVPGVFYSINGPKAEELNIENTSLVCESISGTEMPQAYTGWPYVGFHLNKDFEDYCKSFESFEHYRSACSSSDFVFTVSGGKAPYKFVFTGKLPKGLEFKNNSVVGTVDEYAELGNYDFTLKVTDSQKQSVTKNFSINVKERPNKWVEQGRMTALIHAPEAMLGENDEVTDVMKDLVNTMERQGYGLAMPINFNNGKYCFRSKNIFNNKTDKNLGDVFTPLKKAFEGSSVKFGTYNGNLPLAPQYSYDQAVVMYYDLLKNCEPKGIWHDWLGVCHGSCDAIYSLIKSFDPNIVIINNGAERFTNGDWDIISIEFMADGTDKTGDIWSKFVYEFGKDTLPWIYNWPKAYSMETWHSLRRQETFEKFPDKIDWYHFLKLNISIICEGGISNLDHSVVGESDGYYGLNKHKQMANWANPKDLEPLYHAYTQCYPMYDMASEWGYVNVSLDGKTLYAIALETPRGKVGLEGKKIKVPNFRGDVESVVCMNTGENVSYNLEKDSLVLDTRNYSQDKVANIFKINLKKPIKYDSRPKTIKNNVQIKKNGNLAYHKTARFLTPDCKKTLVQCSGWDRYPYYSIDGNILSDTAPGRYYAWALLVDLEEEYEISKVNIYFSGTPTKYKLEISKDNKEWTEVVTGTNEELKKELFFEFPKTKARYVRMISYKPDGPNQPGGQMGVKEIEVY